MPEHVVTLKGLANKIIAAIDKEEPCDIDISRIIEITGNSDYDRAYFSTLHCHSSVEEFSMEAATRKPIKVHGITKEELIEIVRLAQIEKYPADVYYQELFDCNVYIPSASNLIFYPENWSNRDKSQNLSEYNPTPEEIVEIALRQDHVIKL